MKRREVLKRIGMGLSVGGIASPYIVSSCEIPTSPSPSIHYEGKVVVVGAGLAGLYVSSILRNKGIDVKIIEAGNQLGGRVRSLYNQEILDTNRLPLDIPVELGAEIVYGSDSLWSKKILNADMPMVEIGTLSKGQFVVDGQVKLFADWSSNSNFIQAQNFVSGIADYSGISSATVADASGTLAMGVQPLLNSQVGNFYGSSNDRIGMQGIAESMKLNERGEEMSFMKTHLMQDIIASRFAFLRNLITYNSPVEAIQHDKDNVIITMEDKSTIEANKVIVTVPVAILKLGQIAFIPALPSSMMSAMARIGMDRSLRFIIAFKKNFWGKDTNFIWGMTSAPYCFNAGINRIEKPNLLSITVNGFKAEEFSNLGSGVAVNEIISEIDTLYDGQASRYVNRDLNANQVLSYVQDWGRDKYIQGGASYLLPEGSIEDRANVGKPIKDTLFFAGEATDITGEAGTINGALASAERVAEEVVNSIS